MMNEKEHKKRLEQGVWLDEVDRAFRAWRAAVPSEKTTHLLSGMALTWAESWRLTNPGDFSPATHTFIARSVAAQALKSSGEREAAATETRRRDRVYQQILLLMALFAIVILGPTTMRMYLEQPQPRVIAGQPVAAVIAPQQREPALEAPVIAALPHESPAILTELATTALRTGNRDEARKLALDALYAAPRGTVPTDAASIIANLAQQRQPGTWNQAALSDASFVKGCGGTRLLARTTANNLVMLDTATQKITSLALPASTQAGAIDATCRSALVTNEDYEVTLVSIGDKATSSKRLGSHDAPIVALRFDGRAARAVSVSRDGVGQIWDLSSSRSLARFKSPTDAFNGATFSLDGTDMVTWSDNATVTLWDAKTGVQRGAFAGHASAINAAAFTPDGTRLLTVSVDGTATVWDTMRREAVAVLRPKGGAIVDAWLTPDGSRVVARLDESRLQIWDLELGEPQAIIETADSADTVAISPDGQSLAVAEQTGTVTVWDSMTGAKRLTLNVSGTVLALGFDGAASLRAIAPDAITTWPLPLTREHALDIAGGSALCATQKTAVWCHPTTAAQPRAE